MDDDDYPTPFPRCRDDRYPESPGLVTCDREAGHADMHRGFSLTSPGRIGWH
jgi:hypothetical protein